MNIEAFFKVSYGLYIVSAGHGDIRNGYIANAVFQVTAEPPQFAVCCNKNNFTAEIIKKSGSYSVSVLHKDASAELIGLFGYKTGKEINKFDKTGFITGDTGAPIVVDECVAWFECEVVETFDVGTHLVFIGKIINNGLIDASLDPLTYAYYRDVKKGMAPKNAPTYIDKSKIPSKDTPVKEIQANDQKRHECQACGYIYDPLIGDPEGGIAQGTLFDDIPDDWVCPVCGSRKSDFSIINN